MWIITLYSLDALQLSSMCSTCVYIQSMEMKLSGFITLRLSAWFMHTIKSYPVHTPVWIQPVYTSIGTFTKYALNSFKIYKCWLHELKSHLVIL